MCSDAFCSPQNNERRQQPVGVGARRAIADGAPHKEAGSQRF